MPFREARLRPPCSFCDRGAVERCERCERPLCLDHAHPPEARCRRCENEFRAGRTSARRGNPALFVLSLLYILPLFAVAISLGSPLAIGAVSVWATWAASRWLTPQPEHVLRTRLRRRRFLRERQRPMLGPARPPVPADEP